MKYEKFSLQPEPAAPWLFTLYQDVIREKMENRVKTGETYEDIEALAYGLTFDHALETIASLCADKSSIEQYIKDYKRIFTEMKKGH